MAHVAKDNRKTTIEARQKTFLWTDFHPGFREKIVRHRRVLANFFVKRDDTKVSRVLLHVKFSVQGLIIHD